MDIDKKSSYKRIFIIFPTLLAIAILLNPQTRNLKSVLLFLGIYIVSSCISLLMIYKFVYIQKLITYFNRNKKLKLFLFIVFLFLFLIIKRNLSIYLLWSFVGFISPYIHFVEL